VCVECTFDGACNSDNRNACTDGGFCVENLDLGGGGGQGAPICENTCGTANDDDCDDGGPNADFDVCAYGTDCNDCGERPAMGGGAQPNPNDDDLVALLNNMIRCWSNWSQSNENQGCYQINAGQALYVDGGMVNQIGNVDAVSDNICREEWRNERGFNDADQRVLRELFGCGLLDIRNIWWPAGITAGSGTLNCMYYSPSKSGFGFPDDTRASVVIERCNVSHID
jgi:hypothetical protein